MGTRAKQSGFTSATAPLPETQGGQLRRARNIALTDALLAVQWINKFRGRPAHKRVLDIRQELEDLGRMLGELESGWRDSPKHRRGQTPVEIAAVSRELAELGELQERFRERHNALNARLSHYVFAPTMAYSISTSFWAFGMVPKRSRGPHLVIHDGNAEVTVDEASVVSALCRLAANRELGKVRLCAWCEQNWRISERALDRFCSDRCREQFHSHAPEYKGRKAANQKRYRENKRLGAQAGALAFAGRLDKGRGSNHGKG